MHLRCISGIRDRVQVARLTQAFFSGGRAAIETLFPAIPVSEMAWISPSCRHEAYLEPRLNRAGFRSLGPRIRRCPQRNLLLPSHGGTSRARHFSV